MYTENRIWGCGQDSPGSGTISDSCEHSNEIYGSIKSKKISQLSKKNFSFSKKGSPPRSLVVYSSNTNIIEYYFIQKF